MDNQNRPLWAPWRIEFIRSEKSGGCFLCEKKDSFDSEEEPLMIFRGNHNFVILNRYPYNSGHLMVAPYRHIDDITKMTEDECSELMELTIKAKKTLDAALRPDGVNIGFNLGTAAGAGVKDHIHQHLVPRWIGDTNFMPVLGATRVMPEALEKTAEILQQAWNRL